MNYKQIYAIKAANEKRILQVCPNCPNTSGIYFLLRKEDGFNFGYVGQAKHIRERLASHLSGYQHIDLSIKKHGLYSDDNPTGYKVHFIECPEDMLDDMEKKYIKMYANAGYQMKNSTVGGQGKGKRGLDNARQPKGYYDGIEQGQKNARKLVQTWFKHLDFTTKKTPPTKNQQKAFERFTEYLNGDDNNVQD